MGEECITPFWYRTKYQNLPQRKNPIGEIWKEKVSRGDPEESAPIVEVVRWGMLWPKEGNRNADVIS